MSSTLTSPATSSLPVRDVLCQNLGVMEFIAIVFAVWATTFLSVMLGIYCSDKLRGKSRCQEECCGAGGPRGHHDHDNAALEMGDFERRTLRDFFFRRNQSDPGGNTYRRAANLESGTFGRLGIRGSGSGKTALAPLAMQLENGQLSPIQQTPPMGNSIARQNSNSHESEFPSFSTDKQRRKSEATTEKSSSGSKRSSENKHVTPSPATDTAKNRRSGLSLLSEQDEDDDVFFPKKDLLENDAMLKVRMMDQNGLLCKTPPNAIGGHHTQIRPQEPSRFQAPQQNVSASRNTTMAASCLQDLMQTSLEKSLDPHQSNNNCPLETEEETDIENAEQQPLLSKNRKRGEPGNTVPNPFANVQKRLTFFDDEDGYGNEILQMTNREKQGPSIQGQTRRLSESFAQTARHKCICMKCGLAHSSVGHHSEISERPHLLGLLSDQNGFVVYEYNMAYQAPKTVKSVKKADERRRMSRGSGANSQTEACFKDDQSTDMSESMFRIRKPPQRGKQRSSFIHNFDGNAAVNAKESDTEGSATAAGTSAPPLSWDSYGQKQHPVVVNVETSDTERDERETRRRILSSQKNHHQIVF